MNADQQLVRFRAMTSFLPLFSVGVMFQMTTAFDQVVDCSMNFFLKW
jgi:hypothetical protein